MHISSDDIEASTTNGWSRSTHRLGCPLESRPSSSDVAVRLQDQELRRLPLSCASHQMALQDERLRWTWYRGAHFNYAPHRAPHARLAAAIGKHERDPSLEDDSEVHQPVELWFDGSDGVCHVKSPTASGLTTLHVLQKRIWHPGLVWLPIIYKTWSHYNWSITRQIRPRHRCHVTHLVDHRL